MQTRRAPESNPPETESWGEIQQRAESQLEDLGLGWEDLIGNVLDVGSGESFITKAAREQGIDTEVTSLDIDPRRGEWSPLPGEIRQRSVQADALEMPFADESFDLVVARGSVGFLGIPEAIRVLRPGGELRIYPLSTGVVEQWMMFYYLHEVQGESQEDVMDKMQALSSSYNEELGAYSLEYTALRDEALESLSKDQKLEVIQMVVDTLSDRYGLSLTHIVREPDAREPKAILCYTKPDLFREF
ncbi:class I SAM-dependent methyltransferase [Patescibacteria group bacterium]|nr:class I SAM-dependent methyltransferase [Patescibacteria group bacterium]MBU1868665.1 class I SAM-dependent methyltransferase [Patescibacteria group bacterium]